MKLDIIGYDGMTVMVYVKKKDQGKSGGGNGGGNGRVKTEASGNVSGSNFMIRKPNTMKKVDNSMYNA